MRRGTRGPDGPARSGWRCGSNYSAGREVGEDRRRRRRLGRGGCGICSTTGLAARTPCSDPSHGGRSRPAREGDRRRRRLPALRCEHRARRRLLPRSEPVEAPAGPPGHRGSRDGGGSRRSAVRGRRVRAGNGAAQHGVRLPSRTLDAATVDACAARRRRCSDRRREALRRRGRRGAGPAGPRRLRLRLRDRTLDDVPWTAASRAPRCCGAGRPRLCRRWEDRRARHEPGHRRGVRAAERTVEGDSARAGEARRHRGGDRRRTAAIGRRRGARRNDPNRVRLLAEHAALDAAARA